jgi:hypothetical protein
MEEKRLNIQSTTIEKGLDLAKDFLGKLISPTIEEVGLLISDNIKFYRFKNQVNILLKARQYVSDKNISLKEIPIKILVPLLENASLEDNDDLQDKWAKMLTNMINSESNFQNQIFPYLLSQISLEEFESLKDISEKEKAHREEWKKYSELVKDEKSTFNNEVRKLKKKIEETEQAGFYINSYGSELENLLRLRLVKETPPQIYIEEFQTGVKSEWDFGEKWHSLKAEYEQDSVGYRITNLGEELLRVCELQ